MHLQDVPHFPKARLVVIFEGYSKQVYFEALKVHQLVSFEASSKSSVQKHLGDAFATVFLGGFFGDSSYLRTRNVWDLGVVFRANP